MDIFIHVSKTRIAVQITEEMLSNKTEYDHNIWQNEIFIENPLNIVSTIIQNGKQHKNTITKDSNQTMFKCLLLCPTRFGSMRNIWFSMRCAAIDATLLFDSGFRSKFIVLGVFISYV